jgi:MoaA/NifB/PqqE/SkfB family radical SAM enzyme
MEPLLGLNVEAARSCNFRCLQCSNHSVYSDKHDVGSVMSAETWAQVVEVLPYTENVNFDSHGEPLLNPRLEEMIAAATALGVDTHFTCNFSLMTERRGRALLEAGLRSVQVSVDGATPETYERVRPQARFDRLLANLETFARLRQETEHRCHELGACVVAMEENLDELALLPDLLAPFGVQILRVNALQPFAARMEAQDLRRSPTRLAAYAEVMERTRAAAARHGIEVGEVRGSPGQGTCSIPSWQASVNWRGDVCPCWMMDLGYDYAYTFDGRRQVHPFKTFGNLHERSFQEIWTDPSYVAYRESFRQGTPPPECQTCPVGQGLVCGGFDPSGSD